MFKKIKDNKKLSIPILVVAIVLMTIFVIYIFKRHTEIAVIPITGYLYSSPQYNSDGSVDNSVAVASEILPKIYKANEDKEVKAIVFVIDSYGGEVFAGEEIARAIKEVKKPTVALIRSMGISSAYWIASATGRIFALPTSGVGDIGVTNSYVDNSKQNIDNGLTFHQVAYGKYKDMGNLNKTLTLDEEKLLTTKTTELAEIFIQEVAQNRHLSIEKVKTLADGSITLGQDAIKNGLIDEIGSFREVEVYLSKILKSNIVLNYQ